MKRLRTVQSIAALWALAVVLIGAASPTSLFSYVRYRLFELPLHAEVVVSGEIVVVDEKTFNLRIDQAIVNPPTNPTIQVSRFENWTCASRWMPYAAGQRVLLFLREPEDVSKDYTILGAGGEGELPLIGNEVLVFDRVRGRQAASHRIDSTQIDGTLIPLEEFRSAILGVRSRLELLREIDARFERHFVQPRGSIAALDEFEKSSLTARHMCREARSSIHWIGPLEAADVRWNSRELQAMHATSPQASVVADTLAKAHSLVAAGDFNHDGVSDLLAMHQPNFAAPQLSILTLSVDGAVESCSLIRSEVDGVPSPSPIVSDRVEAITSLGDLDGDGLGEICVGSSDAGEGKGSVRILFLRSDGVVSRQIELGTVPSILANGVEKDFGLGRSLANLGDLDGDGTTELAIGQDPPVPYMLKHGRSILIASVASDGSIARVHRIDGRAEGLCESGDWVGDSLARVGDVNGDGVPDLAIGVSDDEDGGEVRGAVWIACLAPDGSIREKHKISEWEGGFTGVLKDWSRFGHSLAAPGDVDGDGVPDLLVASTGRVWTLLLRKDGSVKSHRKLEIDFKVERPKRNKLDPEYSLEAAPVDGSRNNKIDPAYSLEVLRNPGSPITVICGSRLPNSQTAFWLLGIDKTGALRPR